MSELLILSPVSLPAETFVNVTHDDGPAPRAATAALPSLSAAAIKDLARLFKLLADETRLRILSLLAEQEEIHVRALCDVLHQSQPAVSHHLALLRVAGLIECRREGKHNFYRALPERVKDLLDLVFAGMPEASRRVRFENYVLAYAPPVAH
jgi:ArsR family transcriptional regulator